MIPGNGTTKTTGKPYLLHTMLAAADADHPAVIYDTGEVTYSLTYRRLKKISTMVERHLKELSTEGGFVAVIVDQRDIFPAVLQGVLQAGMGFYCIATDSEFSDEIKMLQVLRVHTVIVEEGVFLPMFPIPSELDVGCMDTSTKLRIIRINSIQLPPLQHNLAECDAFTLNPFEWAYAIRTSGTTGNRKLVLVSHQSIVVNIHDFCQRFHLTKNDVIFGASPTTFDPNIVDIFTSFKSGSTLLYAPKTTKLIPEKLTTLFLQHGVTFMQCTPSLFYRFDIDEAVHFISRIFSLRILAFGGEPCPKREYLRKVIPVGRRNALTIYNLYGTTELSCWAAANLVTLEDVPSPSGILQTLIPDTYYKLVDDIYRQEREILLGSRNRRCIVLACEDGKFVPPALIENGIIYRRTGDIVDLDELPNIVYKGRTDNRMKRQGHFVDLFDLEQRLGSIPTVECVVCFGDFGKVYAIISISDSAGGAKELTKGQLYSEIQLRVPIRGLPDHLIILHSKDIPLTVSGKFDVKKLKHLILEKKISILEKRKLEVQVDDIETILINAWRLFTGSTISTLNHNSTNMNFIEAGGDSVKAMQLTEYVFQELNLFGTFIQQHRSPEMLRILFRSEYSKLMDYIVDVILPAADYSVDVSDFNSDLMSNSVVQNRNEDEHSCSAELLLFRNSSDILLTEAGAVSHQFVPDRVPGMTNSSNQANLQPSAVEMIAVPSGPQYEPYPYQVAYNLYGCVDATPASVIHPTIGKIILGTSNSGYVIAIKSQRPFNYENGSDNILWSHKFPDRIVATVAFSSDQRGAFIACCDCRLYSVDIENGNVKWSFFCGGMLLTCPVVFDEIVVVSTDGEQIFALNQKLGTLQWTLSIDGLKSSLSPHLSFGNIFVATAEGITRIHIETGTSSTMSSLKTIYTNFASDPKHELLCVGTVATDTHIRFLHVLNSQSIEVWRIETAGKANTPVFYYPMGDISCLIYTTDKGKIAVHCADTGIVRSEADVGVSLSCSPAFIETNGNTYIVTVSKEHAQPNTIEFLFLKFPRDIDDDYKDNPTSTPIGRMKLYSSSDAPMLSNILIDDDHFVFGRRNDRLYFVNWQQYYAMLDFS